jgi:hypothetical protein
MNQDSNQAQPVTGNLGVDWRYWDQVGKPQQFCMTQADEEARRRLRMPSGPNPMDDKQYVVTRTVHKPEPEVITDPFEIYHLICDEI